MEYYNVIWIDDECKEQVGFASTLVAYNIGLRQKGLMN